MGAVVAGADPRVTRFPAVNVRGDQPPDLGAERHDSRLLQRRVGERPDDTAAWSRLAEGYRRMAGGWTDWASGHPDYAEPVVAGLAHVRSSGRTVQVCCEVCCGTGQATVPLSEAGLRVVASDASMEMIRCTPALPGVHRVVADVRALPLADGCVDLLVGLNAVAAPVEFTRVLTPDGEILWCSSFGPSTPLYLSAEALLDLLGAGWVADQGLAGRGEWVVARRRPQ